MLLVFWACAPSIQLKSEDSGDSTTVHDTVEQIDSDSVPVDTETTTTPVECDAVPLDEAAYQDFYDATQVHTIKLTMSDAEKAKLQEDPGKYVDANLEIDGQAFPGVGVRWRGDPNEQRWDGKPGFKIGFRAKQSCDTYGGLLHVSLDAMGEDPVQGRQVVESAVLGTAGLPVSRATWATVTVNGEAFGLYANVETVDEQFLQHHGLDALGTLWEGGSGADTSTRGLNDWDVVTGEADTSLIEQLATVVEGSEGEFYPQADAVIDMQQVLRSWAWMVAVGESSSWPYQTNDTYLFQSTTDTRLMMVSWSQDEGWGPEFGWNYVDSSFGLRCVYDTACKEALLEQIQQALREAEALDVPSVAASAFKVSDSSLAADKKRKFSTSSVQQARTALLTTMGSWETTITASLP